MKVLHMLAFVLVIIGGVQWGLIGLAGFFGGNWDVLGMVFASAPQLLWIVYILVGVSAVWLMVSHKADCRMCSKAM